MCLGKLFVLFTRVVFFHIQELSFPPPSFTLSPIPRLLFLINISVSRQHFVSLTVSVSFPTFLCLSFISSASVSLAFLLCVHVKVGVSVFHILHCNGCLLHSFLRCFVPFFLFCSTLFPWSVFRKDYSLVTLMSDRLSTVTAPVLYGFVDM